MSDSDLTQGESVDDVALFTAEIVSAYVAHNAIIAAQLPDLILSVSEALARAAASEASPQVATPAVPIKSSVTPDYIFCLEDGKKFKSLKRHLRAHHHLTPEEYRDKWNLPHDYPLVAPNYAAARSSLAKRFGLGRLLKR